MDIATRFQPRLRNTSFLQKERESMPDDSGPENESLTRRKFQRTTSDADTTTQGFRKPTLPASATRPPQVAHRPSFSERRRSTLRENMRVPSGPREFPSPGKRNVSTSSNAPSLTEQPNNNSRTYLPQAASEPFFNTLINHGQNQHSRFSFGNPSSNDESNSPTTPHDRTTNSFDFIPTVNFDDFQTTLADYTSPTLGDFPGVSGGRALPKESDTGMARSNGFGNRPGVLKQQDGGDQNVSRSQSFRRRMSTAPPAKQGSMPANNTQLPSSQTQPNLSVRTRRQSTMPQAPAGSMQPPPAATGAARPPRKSVGPGLITSMMDRHKNRSEQMPTTPSEVNQPSLARQSSLTKARRTTIQPSASAGAELPRISTLTATTASRQAKVKSLQPPPRDQEPNTPNGRPASKGNPNRAHTPSSSGNKRQSIASGRASGLGARTVSPTDARRLKRLSMMQVPPMPTNFGQPVKGPPTPAEEKPNPMPAPRSSTFPELPRLTQPSPSLIPRKTSSATPSSARASPDGRHGLNGGGVSLSTKSSYQSLLSQSGSTSRLPTPKGRQLHSSSAQYDQDEELIPPVPAIPKSYESPKEHDVPFFASTSGLSSSLKSSFSALRQPSMDEALLPPPSAPPAIGASPRGSMDLPAETPRKRSGEYGRQHRRTLTNGTQTAAPTPKARPPQDQTGRKNNNLQPLRLPPLNLLPLNTPTNSKIAGFPRPSQEIDDRDHDPYSVVQTPEPKRTAKTPSTPMTASKATFWRRQDDGHQKALRSSSSHYALRGLMGFDEHTTKFFEDSDVENQYSAGSGVAIPHHQVKQRSAITPFASGSLPKGSGEFARLRGRPSGEYNDDYDLGSYENLKLQSAKPQGPRPRTSGTLGSFKTAETPSSVESPLVEQAPQLPEQKKEGGGLRRKLSLGWRRSSSKAATHAENKASPRAEEPVSVTEEKKPSKLSKRHTHDEMPPPKLPASATWSGDVPSLPASARPSLDGAASNRRKSSAVSAFGNMPTANGESELLGANMGTMPAKTRALHSEQPQAVNAANRASSWGNFGLGNRSSTNLKAGINGLKSRHTPSASTISANTKDKDDIAADDEMKRLSQKRRDVDTAARETEDLKRRAVARSPMMPDRVLHDRNCTLNIFERGEITDYEKDGIYFTGTKTARKIIGSLNPSPTPTSGTDAKSGNYGYDDERGDYNIVLGDHLAYRYEVVDVLGKGSFGQVVRCVDHRDGGIVAVKIIRNKKRFHQQALVEVGILGRLREWDPDGAYATLSITSSFYFRSHLCIVTPCLSINLYELIRSHNFVGFSLPLIRRFARQLLACLTLLQTKKIIHCDLKPENILLCEARKADVRVIDFGSSCREEEKVYTYIQSRFYRSPEVILGSSYGMGIDMWSFGCILAELWTGYPLFPGENEQEQLACIMEIFGPPDRHLVERCTRKKLFFDSVGKPRVTVSSKGRRRRPSSKTLAQALKTEDEAFIDFITRCLRWDPDRRLKPNEAVNHPFVTNQPFHQRPGIPEEARRAARVRSSAAVPVTNGSIPSPVKRSTTQGNAFAQQAAATPKSERTRPLPETPQTAVRNGMAPAAFSQGSPSKISAANRRHSTILATAGGAAAVAGSKRASNGAVLAGAPGFGAQQQRQGSGVIPTAGNLAQMAARESMGASSASTARWRA